MLKKIALIGVVLIMLFSVAGLAACSGNKTIETDYFRVELNKKDGYAIILELTDLGKEQEILAIPMFVEGLPVKQIGGKVKIWHGGTMIESEHLKKLYIPYTVEKIINEIRGYQENEIVVNIIEIPHAYFNFVRLLESTIVHLSYNPIMELLRPNVFFMYNYLESPNQSYFWYDHISGSNRYILPPDPTRQGFDFAGWYLEPELITLWNEQMPQSAEETLNLYAKWQEK